MESKERVKQLSFWLDAYKHEDSLNLALKEQRPAGFPEHWEWPWFTQQLRAYQKAQAKVPAWIDKGLLEWPDATVMEQASSQATAHYKASLCKGKTLLDLTAGAGVDAFFMASSFEQLYLVEKEPRRAEILKKNLAHFFGAKVQIFPNSAEDFLKNCKRTFDWVLVDPDRRAESGKRTFKLKEGRPSVFELLPKISNLSPRLLIKAAPWMDISLAKKELPKIAAVHILSLGKEVKEILFDVALDQEASTSFTLKVVNLEASGMITSEQEVDWEESKKVPVTLAESIDSFLYLPSAGISKAGIQDWVGHRFSLHKMHLNSHVYGHSKQLEGYPGRIFKVLEWEPYKPKALGKKLKGEKANVMTKNFPISVAKLCNTLGLIEGGKAFLLFFTHDKLGLVMARLEQVT